MASVAARANCSCISAAVAASAAASANFASLLQGAIRVCLGEERRGPDGVHAQRDHRAAVHAAGFRIPSGCRRWLGWMRRIASSAPVLRGSDKQPRTTAIAILNLNGSIFNMEASPGAAVDVGPLCSVVFMVRRFGEVSTKESVHGTMRFPVWIELFQIGTSALGP